jgi:hypothetical protein
MRGIIASALVVGIALTASVQSAEAGRYRQYRGGDCTPTNGPFGFYGNLWCNPTQDQYMRNLGAQWPQKTPASLRYPKRSSNYTW